MYNLFGYRVRLWNSGNAAIGKLSVQLRFSPKSPDFKILSVKHETIPKEEFGKIEEQGSDASSKRFVCELINPKDEDRITLVTTEDAPLAVYSKAEALRIQQQKRETSSLLGRTLLIIAAIFGSFLTSVVKDFGDRFSNRVRAWLRRL